MKIMTGVGGIICAAHKDKAGKLHGHTWEITAWWKGSPDAVGKQALLNSALMEFDHTQLDDDLSWAEQFGMILLCTLQCERIEISRPLEKIYAIIEK